jgi:hypothetical protein
MVILFIAGGLEPGKDGVGDYTRALASECVRRGQTCCLLSLNDAFVSQPIESTESVSGVSVPTLRLPSSLPWNERVKLAVDFRKRSVVDWVSLQFVSYAFQRKGIVRNMAPYFGPITEGCRLHVMFHETWLNTGKGASFKNRIIGNIQRYYIQQLFRQLSPHLISSSNAYYISLLKGIGFTAVETPLFSAIPIIPLNDKPPLPEKLVQSGFCDERGTHPNRLMGLFFGALYPEWVEEPFMQIMAKALEKTGRRPCLVSAGRIGGPGGVRWEKLEDDYAHTIDFLFLGECTPPQITALMQVADFGLSTTPWHILGKSSSVATMLDHGLPVVVTNFTVEPDLPASPANAALLYRCDGNFEAKLWSGLPRQPLRKQGEPSVDRFIGHLTRASSGT